MFSGYQIAARRGEVNLPSREITDDLELLLRVMPPHIREGLHRQSDLKNLIEVVMDLGRPPEARFPSRAQNLGDSSSTSPDLDYVIRRVVPFPQDNRAEDEQNIL